MLNELSKKIHQNAVDKGFFEGEKNTGEMLALIHSEVSEALEADRKNLYYKLNEDGNNWIIKGLADKNFGKTFNNDDFAKEHFEVVVKNTFEDEMADIIIRVLDLCAFKDIDIESHIKAKMRYNATREYKHGKKY